MAWEKIGNIRGPAGLGVPPGGTTGQVLTKTSNADNATAWQTPPTGLSDHGLLSGLGDDDHPQYLTQARGDALFLTQAEGSAAFAPVAHTHDHGALSGLADDDHPQYLLPAEVVAGTNVTVDRPGDGTVVVNATGGGTMDHGALTGLGDDDHPQYLKETEVVAGANVTVTRPGDGTVVVASAAGGVTDHGALSGLADDDHPQYLTQARGDALFLTPAEGDAAYSPASHSHTLDGLSDVNTAGVLDGMALVYDANSGQWIPESIAAGGASTQQLSITFVADATANTTLTDMAAAEDYLGTSVRHVAKADLAAYSHVRFVVRRMATASAAGAVVNLKYSLTNPANTFSAAAWNSIPCQLSIVATNTTLDSGWIAMPAGMKVNDVYLAVTQAGGDGVLDPVLGAVRAYFRGEVAASGGGGGGGASTLDQLTDVTVPTPADEQVLTYVGATSQWESKPAVKVTVDPATPSGGKDGDLWVQTTDVPWTPPAELPRGIVAWRVYDQTDYITVGTATVASVLQLSAVPLKAGRLYKFSFVVRAIGNAAAIGNVRMFTPGALPVANTTLMVDHHAYFGAGSLYSASAGDYPFTVTADGNYTLSLNSISSQASTRVYRNVIMVEDIGPNRGQQ